MNNNPRMDMNDTIPEFIQKMAEGNSGALAVCMSLMKQGAKIDPQAAMGGLSNVLDLDDLAIYASDIWILAKNICDGRADNLVLLLRSRQLGIITGSAIKSAIQSKKAGFDFEDLAGKVKAEIGEFNWPYKEAENSK